MAKEGQDRVPSAAGSGRSFKRALEVLRVSLQLGLTSFGGPVAHLAYFHREYVEKRRWLDERSYADLVALCQFLPGPASSQVGIGIGLYRAGIAGGFLAWLGFTLPSLLIMAAFAALMQGYSLAGAGWVHGLKLTAVAIVAHAVWGMGLKLTPDRTRMTIAALAAALTLLWPTPFSQVAAIVLAGLAGLLLYRGGITEGSVVMPLAIGRRTGALCLILFAACLMLFPLLRGWAGGSTGVQLLDGFYRSGSLVFGGGHVVLPLLEQETVAAGLVGQTDFIAGYGAAQAVPGPLFTFSAYLGYLSGGAWGAVLATAGIFLPAFLLVFGALPFWNHFKNNPYLQRALSGINAAVVGLLLAALYNPVWTSSVRGPGDFVLALILFVLLIFWKLPAVWAVLAGAAGGTLLSFI